MKEVANMFGSQLKDASDSVSETIIETVISESMSRISEELLKVLGLTTKGASLGNNIDCLSK